MICGSVKIDDSRSNNTNHEIYDILLQTKSNVDVIELDSKNIRTGNFKVVHDRLKKLNKRINTTTDNEEIMNMLKLIKTKFDFNSNQLSELDIQIYNIYQ